MILQPDDFEVGMLVTVLQWKPREIVEGGIFTPVTVRTLDNKSWCGDALRIEAIDLPYVRCVHVVWDAKVKEVRLDTREVTFMRYSAEMLTPEEREKLA